MSNLIGRKSEKLKFGKVLKSSKSEFVAVHGRRRVGKTFLVKEYFNYNFDFHLTGLANATTDQQLFSFLTTLKRHGYEETDNPPQNWLKAFQYLIDYLETIQHEGKLVLFFDEMPWLDTAKSDFMIGLEHFWNSWATNRKDILLIACGSAASWMINEIINNHGGLHNRVTERIRLDPFNLSETEEMLKSKNCVFDRYQIVQLYMAMGGIPFYLDAVSPSMSASQNIEALYFSKGGLLQTEYPKLFASLFKNSEKHKIVVEALASKKKGLTRKEVIEKTKLKSGGTLTKVFDELEASGFISSYVPLDNKSRNTTYRLSDFYTSFYLRFVKNNTSFDQGIWINRIDDPGYRAWSGYAFEQVCLHHIQEIKKALGIQGIQSKASSWSGADDIGGVQIDLIIDRRDQVINLFEIKFSINTYKITNDYAAKIRRKISVFKELTKTKKSVFLSMITTFGLERNAHALSLVQNDLKMDVLFE